MTDFYQLAAYECPLGILVTENRVIRYCNKEILNIFRATEAELIDTTLSVIYPSLSEFESIGEVWLRELSDKQLYADERLMKRADGDIFWARVNGRRLENDNPFASCVWTIEETKRNSNSNSRMTKRQREIIYFLAQGLSSKEIAKKLDIAPGTVDQHRNRLLRKMDAKNSIEALSKIYQND